jgi:hypothetical protein
VEKNPDSKGMSAGREGKAFAYWCTYWELLLRKSLIPNFGHLLGCHKTKKPLNKGLPAGKMYPRPESNLINFD